jgi:hypothetical protein
MNAERSPKPPNSQRLVPTVSFSVSQAQLDRLREIAYARDVSLSRVVREALDVAFRVWGRSDLMPAVSAATYAGARDSDGEANKNDIRKPTGWPRQVRRDIARGAFTSIANEANLDDWGWRSEVGRTLQANAESSDLSEDDSTWTEAAAS